VANDGAGHLRRPLPPRLSPGRPSRPPPAVPAHRRPGLGGAPYRAPARQL